MTLDRRAFLKRSALLAAGVVAADQLDIVERLGWTRKLFAGFGRGVPTLYGDGIHDDTHALQAWVDGKRVYDPRGFVRNTRTLMGGHYRLSDTVRVGAAPGLTITNASFYSDFRPAVGRPVLYFEARTERECYCIRHQRVLTL